MSGDTAGDAVPEEPAGSDRGKIFPCPSCGSDLEFHIGQQSLHCPFCGHSQALAFEEGERVEEQDFGAMLERLAERRRQGVKDDLETQEIRCEACGATVEFTGSLTSTDCAYCGSPVQRENAHRSEQRIPVDGVVPFQVERDRARENLDRWLKSRWFAPGDFKQQGIQGKFNGVYLPYWTFDSMTFCRYRGQRGEHYSETVGSGKNRRSVTKTRWYPASGEFQRFFDDVMVPASTSLSKSYLAKLEPWPAEKSLPFGEELLAGYLARTYELPLDEGFRDAREQIDAALRSDVKRRIGGDAQRIDQLESRCSAVTYKHLLLPVWLLSYRYQGRPYQVLINAASGEVFGERPYSAAKIALLILALAAILLLVLSTS